MRVPGARCSTRYGESFFMNFGVRYMATTVADRNPIFAFDRQVRLTTGYERTRESGNSWGLALSYVDLGNNVDELLSRARGPHYLPVIFHAGRPRPDRPRPG